MIEILGRRTPKARKSHQCFHCYDLIPPGTIYNSSVFKYDYVYTIKTHTDCDAMVEKFIQDQRDHISYCISEGLPPLLDMIVDGDLVGLLDEYRSSFPSVVSRIERALLPLRGEHK